jgi:3-oxoacyl-[acyl-carrier protein] reductase
VSARVILLTGSNGGLGQAIARSFLAESPGNILWLGVHTRRENAEKLAAESPDRCRVVPLNVTEAASWKSAVETVLSADGRLDVLVNNAGRHADALLATMPVADWDSVVRSNLDGAFHGCQAVMPAMISQRWGRIINISSLSALLAPRARRITLRPKRAWSV